MGLTTSPYPARPTIEAKPATSACHRADSGASTSWVPGGERSSATSGGYRPVAAVFVNGTPGEAVEIDAVEWIWTISGRSPGTGLLAGALAL